MIRYFLVAVLLVSITVGCAAVVVPPKWSETAQASEYEYIPYMEAGSASLSGQAFLAQKNGGVVKGAGREVTLDPATSIGNEWWAKAGKFWVHRSVTPPSSSFLKARRTTIADADGRFQFDSLPAGKYYVRTDVTWEIGNYQPVQGGLVGKQVDVPDGAAVEVVLNAFAN